MTVKGQGRDPNIFKARYFENGSRQRLGYSGAPIRNGMRGIKWSRDRWRHVTQKSQGHDRVIFRCKYLDKKPSWMLGMADRTAPVVKLTRHSSIENVRSTTTEMKLSKKSSILFTSWIPVDKRSLYLRELVWQPSWQLDNWLVKLCLSL